MEKLRNEQMKFIPLATPDIQPQDVKALTDVLASGMLVQGARAEELEKNISAFLGSKHGIAASNGTATLHLALVALGIGKGDEVIVPAFSFMATANVVELVGATPVFVDIQLDTFNIDADQISQAITPKTKAIIPVHEFGLACDIEKIMKLAKQHGLFVIEDAACALGAAQNNKMAGTFGDFGSFSFHPRKAITSGEGGMLVTSNDALMHSVRVLRNHGIDQVNGKTEFVAAGFNYRLTDLQAALVNSQLARIQDLLSSRMVQAKAYFDLIHNSNIRLPHVPNDRNHTWQTFHILLEKGIDRDSIIKELADKKIGSNYGAQCIPCQKYFFEKYRLDCKQLFPNSMQAYQQGLAIPLHKKLELDDIKYIAEQLNKI